MIISYYDIEEGFMAFFAGMDFGSIDFENDLIRNMKMKFVYEVRTV